MSQSSDFVLYLQTPQNSSELPPSVTTSVTSESVASVAVRDDGSAVDGDDGLGDVGDSFDGLRDVGNNGLLHVARRHDGGLHVRHLSDAGMRDVAVTVAETEPASVSVEVSCVGGSDQRGDENDDFHGYLTLSVETQNMSCSISRYLFMVSCRERESKKKRKFVRGGKDDSFSRSYLRSSY